MYVPSMSQRTVNSAAPYVNKLHQVCACARMFNVTRVTEKRMRKRRIAGKDRKRERERMLFPSKPSLHTSTPTETLSTKMALLHCSAEQQAI